MLGAHVHERYSSLSVCVFVVTLVPAYDVTRVCNKLNLPARSSLNSKRFSTNRFYEEAVFHEL